MTIPIPETSEIKELLNLSENPEFVAVGGFKAVFRFTNPSGVLNALKAVYLPKANSDDESLLRKQLVARAKREIEALGKCQHPNIVKLGSLKPVELAIGGHDYLVYSEEFLAGTSLVAWLDEDYGECPFGALHCLMEILVDLLENLASLGFLHRDIKPDNIMDTGAEKRRFVVLDMGIAYKMDGTQLTRGGSPPGTLRFMAPELLLPDYKDNMDFRCDLYSAALTIYVLAAKSHPFAPKPESPYATAYRIIKTRPEPLHNLRPDLPPRFCQIIDRCIRKKPALRYSKLDKLKEDLKGVIE